MNKKYVLHPGYIRSKWDGDEHYITAYQLAYLYGVNIHKCIIAREGTMVGLNDDKLIHLYPSYHGNYTLPIN